ncbi:MAG: hypothetical protein IKP06_01555 [Elusimicrobiaceae bacterium]|nr:hypothetical protein [Elusimicrobiaceae bacterium]
MEEKVKVCVEVDKQFIREVMVAVGITAADPKAANKLLEKMGNEIVLDEEMIDDEDKSKEMRFTFAAIAIGAAAKMVDAEETAEKQNHKE